LILLLLLACDAVRPATFDCGKLICAADQICLHWDLDSGEPPDAGHGCVDAPAECNGVPTCDCAADVCLSECDLADGGVSCHGDEPA
jgi:hypothetical protein